MSCPVEKHSVPVVCVVIFAVCEIQNLFNLPVQLYKGIFIELTKHPLSCRSIVEIDANRLNNLVEGLFNYRAEPANPREQLREQSANWNLFQEKKSNQ